MDNVTKPYTFRKLNALDLAPMCKLLSKLKLKELAGCLSKDEFANITKSEAKKDDIVRNIGFKVMLEMANHIILNLPQCEKEVFELLSSVSGMSVEEIKNLDFSVFCEMVIDFVKKEEFKDFIKVVSKLFK